MCSQVNELGLVKYQKCNSGEKSDEMRSTKSINKWRRPTILGRMEGMQLLQEARMQPEISRSHLSLLSTNVYKTH